MGEMRLYGAREKYIMWYLYAGTLQPEMGTGYYSAVIKGRKALLRDGAKHVTTVGVSNSDNRVISVSRATLDSKGVVNVRQLPLR